MLDPDATCSCHDADGQHLEAYPSTTAIANRLSRARGVGVSFDTVAAEWETEDDARRAVTDAGRLLGQAVSTVVTLFDPTVIVVTGRFAACGDAAVVPLRKALEAMRPRGLVIPEVLVTTAAEGKHAERYEWVGVRGAGRLAIELNTSVDNPPR